MRRLAPVLLLLAALLPALAFGQRWSYYPPPGTVYTQNASNGASVSWTPQSTTGQNVIAVPWTFDVATGNFAPSGGLYGDPTTCAGVNILAVGSINSLTDPFATGMCFEQEYDAANSGAYPGSTGTATGGSASTLVDSGKTWGVNQWAAWIAYDSTKGCSALIASNTSTTITISGSWTATSGACSSNPASGDTYQIMVRQFETYFEYFRSTSGGSIQRYRPFFFGMDKGTQAAQGALASNGALTITAATAANPAAFTTSVNHGFPSVAGNTFYVKFANLAGGTWGTSLNGNQYVATVTGATTFTVAVNATGFGTYTASSGTVTAEPTVNGAQIAVPSVQYQGLQFVLPSWNPNNGDSVALLQDGQFTLYGRPGSNSNYGQITINPLISGGTASYSANINNTGFFRMEANVSSTQWELDTYQAGTNNCINLSVYRPNSTDGDFTVGCNDQGYVQGLVNLSNKSQTASRSMLNLKAATSQTGDYIDLWDATGNTTRNWYVDSGGQQHIPNITTGTNADFVCASSAGVLLIQSSACTISSQRFKEDIRPVVRSGLDAVGRLVASSFRLREHNRDPNGNVTQVGLIAENVASAMPECAVYEDDMRTVKSYRPECVTAFLAKATSEQSQALWRQQLQIAALALLCLALGGLAVRRRPRVA